MVSRSFITSPPPYSLKMIRNTICNICLSYLNPFIHLCPSVTSSCSRSQCRTYSYRYMWIGTPLLIPPSSLSPPFGLYDFFLFKTICDMCMVLSTSIMDEIPKIFVLREENYHQELKRGGGAMHKFMYLLAVFRQFVKGNSCFQFSKDWVLVQTDIRMQ